MTARRRQWLEAGAVFAAAWGFLIALAPSAPFTKELGVCESGAVRDVLAGNIILPHFLPGPMVHVPPLYWWIAALSVKALGWTELALRLPALGAAALTCLVVFVWTRQRLGRTAAFWSAGALLLCHFFLDAARQPRMDSMLALAVTAAVLCLERALSPPSNEPPPSAHREQAVEVQSAGRTSRGLHYRRVWFLAASAAFIGLATLTKGVLGIVLPGLVIGLFLLVRGRLRELFDAGLVATFSAGLAIGLGWFLAAYEIGGTAFLAWQVQMNLWSRFIPAAAGGASYCAHPFWYFAPQTLRGFLPWSLYLPAFAWAAWRKGRKMPEPLLYTACWFAAIFIFFSSSRGKCPVYILPAFPPLAILTGWTIGQAQNAAVGDGIKRLFSAGSAAIAAAAAIVLGAAVALMAAGLPAKMPLRLHPTDRDFLEIFAALTMHTSPLVLLWMAASAVGIGCLCTGLMRRTARWQAAGALTVAAAGGWFWFAVMNPALARRETLKPFALEVAQTVPAGASVGHIGLGDCELNFYSPQPLQPLFRVSCAAPPRDQFIVVRQRDFEAIPAARRSCLTPLLESAPVDSIGRRLLLERLPAGTPAALTRRTHHSTRTPAPRSIGSRASN